MIYLLNDLLLIYQRWNWMFLGNQEGVLGFSFRVTIIILLKKRFDLYALPVYGPELKAALSFEFLLIVIQQMLKQLLEVHFYIHRH